MIDTLRKTARRTLLFLAAALICRHRQRHYAPLAWGMFAGWIWLLSGVRGEPTWPAIAVATGLCAVIAAVCAIDARYGIIPDSLVLALAAGGLIETLTIAASSPLWRLLEAGLFFLAAWLFRSAYRRIRGYDGLGFGDVKFATAAVLWVGLAEFPRLLLVAVASAFVSVAILRVAGARLDRRQAISFGPHLAIGLWLCWIGDVLQIGL